jgi:hypothetical protein
LRILVEKLHVGVGRSAVEIEVIFLNILSVVALAPREPEKTLFEDGIFAVPKRQGEAEILSPVRDAGYAVFIPAIGSRPRMIVWKVIPCAPVWTVILSHSSPCPLA